MAQHCSMQFGYAETMKNRYPSTTALASAFLYITANASTTITPASTALTSQIGGDRITQLLNRDGVSDFIGNSVIEFPLSDADPTDITEKAQSLIYSEQNQLISKEMSAHKNLLVEMQFKANIIDIADAPVLRQDEINASIYTLAQTDFDAAIAQVELLEIDARDQARLSALLALFWREQAKALTASDKLLSPQLRDEFLSVIAFDLPAYDMQRALAFFDRAHDRTRYDMAFSIAYELGKISVDDAHHWLAQIPSTDIRANAMLGLIESALHTKPALLLMLVGEFEQLSDQKSIEYLYARIAMENRALVDDWLRSGVLSQHQYQLLDNLLPKIDQGEYDDLGC